MPKAFISYMPVRSKKQSRKAGAGQSHKKGKRLWVKILTHNYPSKFIHLRGDLMVEEKGTFAVADMEKEAEILKELMQDPEVKTHMDEWEQEYQIRKKLRQAREEAGITQKEVGMLSGLDQRAISRVETNTNVSTNLKTIVKYLNAIGYELEIKKVASN